MPMREVEPAPTLFVVDDDETFLKLACHYLDRAGYSVTAFSDGMAALERALSSPPDLILVDIRMPGLDGFGLLGALRSNQRTALLPVVFLTAIRDVKAQRKGMRLGADDFLVKPVTQGDLLDAVKSRLERARVLRFAAVRAAVQAGAEADRTGADPDAPAALASLQEIARAGGYKMLRKLGEGGMSRVYLARDLRSDRQVALKVIRFDQHADDDLVRRFALEHATLERMSCPHVARLFAHGITDEYAYLAMEYFAGGTLRELMRTALAPARVLDLMEQIAEGVASLHLCDIVHRDLKPDNVMLRADGGLAITDLGIAADLGMPLLSGAGGAVMGTPAYMAPEQASGAPVSKAADVYSMGVMFHEMLAGEKPFGGNSLESLLQQHATAPAARLAIGVADFQTLVDAMLAKAPEQRPADAQVVLAELRGLRHTKAAGARRLDATVPNRLLGVTANGMPGLR